MVCNILLDVVCQSAVQCLYHCVTICRTAAEGIMATAVRTERLDARVTPEEKETIETAANLRGTSYSDFVRMALKEAALNTIREHEVLALNQESRRVFIEALLNPPKPNEKALAAAKRFRQEIA